MIQVGGGKVKKNILEQRREKAFNELQQDFNDYYFGGGEEKALEAVNRIRQQEAEMDKAFEFIVHELRMMECFLDRDINCLTDFELDMYRNDMLISAEEFTVRFLKKVEDSL